MLVSIATIILSGLCVTFICKKLHIPNIIGFIVLGICIGPYGFHILESNFLRLSADIRKAALVIILIRAGFALQFHDIKQHGTCALRLSFVPAIFEMFAVMILAPLFFQITYLEAALLGSVLAAVSPAIIIPKMLKLIDEGYGTNKKIPHMILAGATMDDVFVVVIFSSILTMLQGKDFHFFTILNVPLSILNGVFIGYLLSYLLKKIMNYCEFNHMYQIAILLSFAFFQVAIEDKIDFIPYSAYISIMIMSMNLSKSIPSVKTSLGMQFQNLWKLAEIFLFVLVGVSMNLHTITSIGGKASILILSVLMIRMLGVYVCFLFTPYSFKERCFFMISYLPKATVQAAIGSVPLSLGLPSGEMILLISTLAIFITAPIGALAIEKSYPYLLYKSNNNT